jgi:diaminopimelate decarboxylase
MSASTFSRRDGELHVENVALQRIAEAVGTPTYVYSGAHLDARYHAVEQALARIPHLICYAVKANGNLAVLQRFARLGAGFDIVSGGELERVLRAGGDPAQVVFSGVGKSSAEIDFALKQGIACFNVESESELDRLRCRAELLSVTAPVSIRVNPDIDARTHPYISTGLKENKFGVSKASALTLYQQIAASDALTARGIDCHIGSQIVEAEPLIEALDSLLDLVDTLTGEGISLRHLDLGGGFGVRYQNEPAFDLDAYATEVEARLKGRDLSLIVEPGRYLVAEGGVLLTRVEYLKPAEADDAKSFAVVDAAMNDLIRPTLYDAWHPVEVVADAAEHRLSGRWDLVGPICESSDFLALNRHLNLAEGDLLTIGAAGAYGFVQSSNYNSRGRAAEVLVDGDDFFVARRRETLSDQLALERLPE